MNTSPNVPESLKLLRFIWIGIFSIQLALYQSVTQGDNFPSSYPPPLQSESKGKVFVMVICST